MSLMNDLSRLPFKYSRSVTLLAILVWLIQIFIYLVNLYLESKKSNKTGWSSSSNRQYSASAKEEDHHHHQRQRQRQSMCIYKEDVEIVLKRLGIAGEENTNSDFSCTWLDEEEANFCYKTDEVKAAFDVFDENKDGFIDAYELQRVLCVLGFKEGFDLESCRKMIMVAKPHINGDYGRLDFNEFLSFLEKGLC